MQTLDGFLRDLPKAMAYSDGWQARVKEIHVSVLLDDDIIIGPVLHLFLLQVLKLKIEVGTMVERVTN